MTFIWDFYIIFTHRGLQLYKWRKNDGVYIQFMLNLYGIYIRKGTRGVETLSVASGESAAGGAAV